MTYLYKFILFALVFSCSLYSKSHEHEEAIDLAEAFSFKKNTPVVITPEAEESFLLGKKKWKWILIDGVYVGFSKEQKTKKLISDIKRNVQEYNSALGAMDKFELSLAASHSDLVAWLDYFSDNCIKNFKREGEIKGMVTFHTPDAVSSDVGCKVLIYSFTVNGIKLTADKKNNLLLVTSPRIEGDKAP